MINAMYISKDSLTFSENARMLRDCAQRSYNLKTSLYRYDLLRTLLLMKYKCACVQVWESPYRFQRLQHHQLHI
jgi:hypothetical protein